MNGYELLVVLAVLGVMVWYVVRVTRVADALAEAERRQLEQEMALIKAVNDYIDAVILPEMTARRALHVDPERVAAHCRLVGALGVHVRARTGDH